MNWTSFAMGALLGAVVFDLLWRFTFHLHTKLANEYRTYIRELRQALGLEP